jgi:hypothetical protein
MRDIFNLAEERQLSLGYLVLLVMQILAGFDDHPVIDLAFEIFQAVIFFVVEKVGDVGV